MQHLVSQQRCYKRSRAFRHESQLSCDASGICSDYSSKEAPLRSKNLMSTRCKPPYEVWRSNDLVNLTCPEGCLNRWSSGRQLIYDCGIEATLPKTQLRVESF